MLHWSIEKKILELKYTWKISRNASDTKTNLFVTVKEDSKSQGIGEAAPNVRYNETPEELEKQFDLFLSEHPEKISSLEELSDMLNRIALPHALRFAIESAFIHYQCSKQNKTIYELLGLNKPTSIFTAYSVPIMETGKMKEFYLENNLSRFRFIKIKVNAENAVDAIDYLSSFSDQPLLVDANEAFKDADQCIFFFEKIKSKNIQFIEQPMPSTMVEESLYLKKHSPFPLFADESITDTADFSLLKKMFDGINVKLMKAGGYLNGIRLLREAKANNMKTMIGCMVETSLGISSAMHLCSLADYADLDSFLLLKNEPYNLIKENKGELKFS